MRTGLYVPRKRYAGVGIVVLEFGDTHVTWRWVDESRLRVEPKGGFMNDLNQGYRYANA